MESTGPPQFLTTHWSLVGAASPDEASQTRAREALEELCRTYWYPLYANEWNRARTQKRGGQVQFVEWDAFDPETRYAEASDQADNPEHLFDREWALETVTGALQALREEMTTAGKGDHFEALKSSLTGEDGSTREEIALQLDMSEDAVKVAIHRLRKRYRELLRAAIAETVSSEADLDDEMRYLVEVLRRQ